MPKLVIIETSQGFDVVEAMFLKATEMPTCRDTESKLFDRHFCAHFDNIKEALAFTAKMNATNGLESTKP